MRVHLIGAIAMALASSAPADAGTAATQHVITRPDWRQKPTGDDMAKYYPQKAFEDGVSGMAVITCNVTKEGALTACKVVREKPKDYGFGEAALALSASFLMEPKTIDGQPVDGGTAFIPLIFSSPEEKLGDGVAAFTRVGIAGSEAFKGVPQFCPDGDGQCNVHPITPLSQPDLKSSRKLAANSPTTGATFARCTAGVDGSLQGCAFLGDTSPEALAIVNATIARLKLPEKADDGLPLATTTVLVPFGWESIAKMAARKPG